jgi:hypothetical protein
LRRRVLWAVSILLLVVIAVVVLRRDAARVESPDAEVNTEGHFVSDSLGVTLLLPQSPGWSFRRDPPVPGGSYITAVHESQRATVRLFVKAVEPGTTLESVLQQRRIWMASLFGADSLDQIIAKVMQEEMSQVDGHPLLQWQAMTHPLSIEEGRRSRVMFMWSATVWPQNAYECIAMMLIPTDLLPEEQREYDALVQDVASIMQSFRIRS